LDSLHWTYAGTTLRTRLRRSQQPFAPASWDWFRGRTVRNPRYGRIHEHRTRPTPPLSTPSTAIPRPRGSQNLDGGPCGELWELQGVGDPELYDLSRARAVVTAVLGDGARVGEEPPPCWRPIAGDSAVWDG